MCLHVKVCDESKYKVACKLILFHKSDNYSAFIYFPGFLSRYDVILSYENVGNSRNESTIIYLRSSDDTRVSFRGEQSVNDTVTRKRREGIS